MKKIVTIVVLLIVVIFIYFMSNKKMNKSLIIGARPVPSTMEKDGRFFISPNGSGRKCTKDEPCGLESLDLFSGFLKKRINAGDVIFFRGGIYNYSAQGIKRVYLKGGVEGKPVIYESYPGEIAVFDGSKIDLSKEKEEWREGRLELRDNYTILRKVEIRNMPQYGLSILSNNNIVEGCTIHNNHLSGISILNFKDGYSVKDTAGSYNIVRDNIVYNNSDIGLKYGNYNDGDNADGISVSSGVKNLISHNTVYSNSDDGIDTWKSMNSVVEYNRIYDNGKGVKGNGNGIKLGGASKKSPLGSNAIARHNLVYSNRYIGININSGKNVLMEYNTVYNNKSYGYTLADDSLLKNNISFKNKSGDTAWSKGKIQKNNSWQLKKELDKSDFQSLDINSSNFLRPLDDEISKMGVYAN